jgi:integrase/recombinase XerD
MPVAANGIQILLRRYGQQAGLTSVRVSPHTLRHTFAKNYIMNGGDIFSLQRILGHTDISTVKIYLNLFAVDVKKQHTRFSPVDTLASTLHTKGF